jgi:hypothetical protein
MLTQVEEKKYPDHPSEDDYRKFWEAYDALTKLITDYKNFEITFNITLTPRFEFYATAEDIKEAIKKNYRKTTGYIKKATLILQDTHELLLKPFSLHAQRKIYAHANSLKTRPSPERLLGGLLIGLLGTALVLTAFLIGCTPAGATIPIAGVVMNMGYAAQYISAAMSLLAGAALSYFGLGMFNKGLRCGLSKNLHELGGLVNEERETHLIRRHVLGKADLSLEDYEVYYSHKNN